MSGIDPSKIQQRGVWNITHPSDLEPQAIEPEGPTVRWLYSSVKGYSCICDRSKPELKLYDMARGTVRVAPTRFSQIAVNSYGEVMVSPHDKCGIYDFDKADIGPTMSFNGQEVVKIKAEPGSALRSWLILTKSGELWCAYRDSQWHKQILATDVLNFDANIGHILVHRRDNNVTLYQTCGRLAALWVYQLPTGARVLLDNYNFYVFIEENRTLNTYFIGDGSLVKARDNVEEVFESEVVVARSGRSLNSRECVGHCDEDMVAAFVNHGKLGFWTEDLTYKLIGDEVSQEQIDPLRQLVETTTVGRLQSLNIDEKKSNKKETLAALLRTAAPFRSK